MADNEATHQMFRSMKIRCLTVDSSKRTGLEPYHQNKIDYIYKELTIRCVYNSCMMKRIIYLEKTSY